MRQFWLPSVATLMSLLALARMPYGYYMLLRATFCAAYIYYLVQGLPKLSTGHRVAIIGLAALYNPIIPVHLASKPIWSLVNLATVVYLWLLASRHYKMKE